MSRAESIRTASALLVASIAVMVSLAAAGFALISRFDQTNSARHNNAHVWHAVICSIEQVVVADKKRAPAEKRAALVFYDRLLTKNVKTAACGLIDKIPRR